HICTKTNISVSLYRPFTCSFTIIVVEIDYSIETQVCGTGNALPDRYGFASCRRLLEGHADRCACKLARRRGGAGRAERRPHLQRMDRYPGWDGERRHQGASVGLPAQAGLHRRLTCQEGP